MFLYADLSFLEISRRSLVHNKYRLKDSILLDNCSRMVAMTQEHKVILRYLTG